MSACGKVLGKSAASLTAWAVASGASSRARLRSEHASGARHRARLRSEHASIRSRTAIALSCRDMSCVACFMDPACRKAGNGHVALLSSTKAALGTLLVLLLLVLLVPWCCCYCCPLRVPS